MPLDGTVVSSIKNELTPFYGSRIDKVYQPEADEIIIQLRGRGTAKKLLLTATSQNPRAHFTESSKENPMTPPLFCMVLRKHLSGGRLVEVTQPNFERILEIHVESLDEMGDLSVKRLIIEIMGKHSNIILVDSNYVIIDSVKRVPFSLSTVRQVLPGLKYALPPSFNKENPMLASEGAFVAALSKMADIKVQEAIYKSFTGISSLLASELCHRAGIDPSLRTSQIDPSRITCLFNAFDDFFAKIKEGVYSPVIIYKGDEPVDFHSTDLELFAQSQKKYFPSPSEAIEAYYKSRDLLFRSKQKSQDLRKLLQNHLERLYKKKEIQFQTLKDVENRDYHKICGELITANIHSLQKGMTTFTTANFYHESMEEIEIELDPTMTSAENAQYYFKKYNKAKRTLAALTDQRVQTDDEIFYLEGVLSFLEGKLTENDIIQVRQELAEEGYIKSRKEKNRRPVKSAPMKFMSTEGLEILAGKNNKQNEELTFRTASTGDIWFHVKNVPGSHVILRTQGREAPESALFEAAQIAALFSRAKDGAQIDYTYRKYVKKLPGAKPGMVTYDNFKTIYVSADMDIIKKLNVFNENI